MMRDKFISDTLKTRIIRLDDILNMQGKEKYINIQLSFDRYGATRLIEFKDTCCNDVIKIISCFLWDAAKSNRYVFKVYIYTVFNFIRDLVRTLNNEVLKSYLSFKDAILDLNNIDVLSKKNKLYMSRFKHLYEYCRCFDMNIPNIYVIPVEDYDRIARQNNRADYGVDVVKRMKNSGVINALELVACFGSRISYDAYNNIFKSKNGWSVKYYLDISSVKDKVLIERIVDFLKDMISLYSEINSFYSMYIS